MQWLNWAVFSISNKDVLLGWDSVVMAKDFKSINTNTTEYNQIEFKDDFTLNENERILELIKKLLILL